jgi:CRP/FNR family transcriptional regulator
VTVLTRKTTSGLRALDSAPWIRATPFRKGVSELPARLLTDLQRQHLATLATRLHLPPRKIVYREGADATWVFFVAEGVVKAFRDLPSGKRRVTAFLVPGDIFGLAENGQYVNAVRTVTEATLFRIRTEELTDVLRRDPELGFQFLCKVTNDLRRAQRQTIVLGRRDARGRLAMFLGILEKHASGKSDPDIIPVLMSRSDIADYLALSLEAVSRATRELATEGILRFEDRHTVRVTDRRRFQRLIAAN